MGSGYFPLEGKRATALLGAAQAVEDVCEALVSDVYSGESGGSQFDNAASDGGSVALLRLAVQLIRGEVRREGGA